MKLLRKPTFTVKDAGTFLVYIVYRVLLDLIYTRCLTEPFSYLGLTYEKPQAAWALLFWLVYAAFALWNVHLTKGQNLSDQVLVLLFLINFAPAMTMFTYKKTEHWPLYLLYWFCLALAHRLIRPGRKRVTIQLGDRLVRLMAYASVALSVFVWGYYGHFHLQLGFSDVYDLRMAARDFRMPTVITYIYGSLNSVIPLFVILSIHRRKRLESALFFVAQLAIFFTNGSRITVFLLAFALFMYFFTAGNGARVRYMPHVLTAGLLVSLLAQVILGFTSLNYVVVRRLVVTPVSLDYFYYDFFREHSFDFFRSSLMSRFGFTSPYSVTLPRLIGETYFNAGMNANNGMFSDAYANLGPAGMVVMPILVAAMLRLGDRCSSGLPVSLLMPAVVSFYMIAGASFFTNLLTHGFAALLLVLYLVPRQSRSPASLLAAGS